MNPEKCKGDKRQAGVHYAPEHARTAKVEPRKIDGFCNGNSAQNHQNQSRQQCYIEFGAKHFLECCVNPVTGRSERTVMDEAAEIAEGAKAHPEILKEYGAYANPRLQAYVDGIGQKLARQSHRANLKWTFTVLDSPEILFARVTAEQKMLVVNALKNKGEIVAVTGDGVNDAPALKSAHIGIAMGLAGTDVAKAAADMILLDDNFASIVNAVEEGRAVFENIRKFLTYILTSNIPELIPFLAFVLFKIPLPLTIIQILAVDLGTDMLPALALGAEPPDPGLMRQPPRPPHERLLSWSLLARAYLWLGMLEAGVALGAFFTAASVVLSALSNMAAHRNHDAGLTVQYSLFSTN